MNDPKFIAALNEYEAAVRSHAGGATIENSLRLNAARTAVVAHGARQAEPVATGDVWLKHDDDLRFVARVLESPCPKEDIDAARAIVNGLRTTARAHVLGG